MDSLDRLIQLAQIEGKIHTHCLLQGNWQLAPPQNEEVSKGCFHIVLKGECDLTLGQQKFHLQAGDLFFLPKGAKHQLNNHYKTSEKPTALYTVAQKSAYQALRNGANDTDSARTTPNIELFCGAFTYRQPATLIDNLPDYLHFSLQDTPLAALIELFKVENNDSQFAYRSIINALSQVLFAYILRTYLSQNQATTGVLAALQDKRLSGCLQAMLQSPEQPWQVEKLARLANMSRANFLRVFQQTTGTSPTKLLTSIRLQQAALLLRTTQGSILSVALDVGYQSESHFSKAFKTLYGMPPSLYRKIPA